MAAAKEIKKNGKKKKTKQEKSFLETLTGLLGIATSNISKRKAKQEKILKGL